MPLTVPIVGGVVEMSAFEAAVNALIEGAVSASAVGYPLYGSTSAGLAATSDGQGFSTLDETGLHLYLNDGGTADEQGSVPLSAVTDALSARLTTLEAVGAVGAEYAAGGPVAVATTANITLSGEQTIDGVLTSTSRILVKDQTAPEENGIYVTASGAWTRATDMDAAGEVAQTAVFVTGGTVNGNRVFATYSTVTTLGTDAIDWVQALDLSSQITSFEDLALTGNTTAEALTVDGNPVAVQSDSIEFQAGIRDGAGNTLLAVDDTGALVADFSRVPAALRTGGTFAYDVNQVFVYGQSESVGQAVPAITTTAKYDNLMFSGGMRPQYDYPAGSAATWYADFTAAVEEDSPTTPSLAETPCSGLGDMVKQLIADEYGLTSADQTYKLLLSAPGYGNTAISGLDTGSPHYGRMVEQQTYGASVSATNEYTYGMQMVGFMHGPNDYLAGTTRATYETLLTALVSDFATDTGTSPIWAITQTASHIHYAADNYPDIALAQLDVADAVDGVYIAGATYHLPYADAGHLNPIGSKLLGAYMGLVYFRVLICGDDWKPVQPTTIETQGAICQITFNVPKGKLVWDTTEVPAQTNYGFQLFQSDGTTAITISSVAITDYNRVKIVAASTIPSGAILRYAHQGNSKVGLGNLRDTQGETLVFDPNGIAYPLHNWCVIFEETL